MILIGLGAVTLVTIFGSQAYLVRGLQKNDDYFAKLDFEAEEKHHERQLQRDWYKYVAKPAYKKMLRGHLDNVSAVSSFSDACYQRSIIVGINKSVENAPQKIQSFIDDNGLEVEIIGDNKISDTQVSLGHRNYLFYLSGKSAHVYDILIHKEFEIENANRLCVVNRKSKNMDEPIFKAQMERLGLLNA